MILKAVTAFAAFGAISFGSALHAQETKTVSVGAKPAGARSSAVPPLKARKVKPKAKVKIAGLSTAAAKEAATFLVPQKIITKKLIASNAKGSQYIPGKTTGLSSSDSIGTYSNIGNVSNPFTGAVSDGALGVSSIKIQSTEKPAALSKISFVWVTYNAIDAATVEHAQTNSASPLDGEVRAWQMPTITYNFSKEISFGVMPQFFNTYFGDRNRTQGDSQGVRAAEGSVGETQPYSLYMGNTALQLVDKKIAQFGRYKLEGSFRYDIPTSQRSNLSGAFGENWDTLALDRSFGRFDLQLMFIGRIYFQQYNTSALLNTGGASANQQLQNASFRDYEILNVSYNATPKIVITLSPQVYNTTYYSDPNNNRPAYVQSHRVMNIDFTYNFTKKFALATGLFEDYAINGTTQTWGNAPFDPINNGNSTELYLQAMFTIL